MNLVHPFYRRIPAIHRLLDQPELRDAIASHGRESVMTACREAVADLRDRISGGELDEEAVDAACADLDSTIMQKLNTFTRPAYPEIINASGVLIHTNLGRAPLGRSMPSPLESYLALEYNIEEGRRGQRLAPLIQRLTRLCGSEWAVMVNNNAAAVLLILSAHAHGRDVIVSRGQLIEIGGSFRLPDVMAASGSRLVEVGCTNRTHLYDYERAITGDTAALLVAHHSNYRVVGFTHEPAIEDLAALAHSYELPLIVDQGSGNLYDLERWGFAGEPSVQKLLAAGADIVCFSGDKLLGGPQAGIVAGTRRWVEPLGKHPLYRALRPDKTALVMMDHVLQAHINDQLDELPLYRMLHTPLSVLKRRAAKIGRRLRARGIPARGLATKAALGGGTTPGSTIASHGIALDGGSRVEEALRMGSPAVVGRIEKDEVILDLRTVFPDQDRGLGDAVIEAYGIAQENQEEGR
jgi:L-seryl-tRNA(Ser) seleniumtransferase